jgi:outer membrane protein OmpA-like peptidoglycan-associated protein
MNISGKSGKAGIVVAAVAAILAGCASTPEAPAGSAAVRSKLSMLKADSQLAGRIPVLLEQSEAAVVLAETSQKDKDIAAHRVYLADRMVDTARATAQTRLAEEQRAGIKQQNDENRLAARTREADAATRAATAARSEAEAARMAAQGARSEADAARAATDAARLAAESSAAATALAEAQKMELERQIALMQAKTTERGIVLTLGDVLFATGSEQLKAGATGNLDRLVEFMAIYADRTATIEGHTDSVGEEASNQALSQRRADSVRSYLAGKGVAASRLTAIGKGEGFPIAGNDSAGSRQQNRRVEVVIGNTP